MGVKVEGFIVSDDQAIHNNQETVSLGDYMKIREDDDIIIIGVSDNIVPEIENNLISVGIYNHLRVPNYFFEMV